jgi:hypothetical protein
MKSKISALGLALVAALALSALGAQAASAANKHHVSAAQAWSPKTTAKNLQVFESTTDGGAGFKCKKLSATGNIPTTAEEITVTPFYEECEAFEGGETKASAFVENGGCDYRFASQTTADNPTGGSHANVSIVNHESPGEPCHIQIKVTAFKFKCSSVPNQEVEHAVRYEQDGEKAIWIKATAHGIESTTTNSIACPTESGETEVHTNGSYEGEVTVEAQSGIPITLNENVT